MKLKGDTKCQIKGKAVEQSVELRWPKEAKKESISSSARKFHQTKKWRSLTIERAKLKPTHH